MRRREFIAILIPAALSCVVALAAPHQTQAQNTPRVGWMFPGASAGNPTELAGFKEGLRELGYVEGRDVVVEYRFGENSVERLPEFATEFARLNVSVIVAIGELAIRAARRAAPAMPIVFLTGDPVATGIVSNLSRPGGNITGVSTMRAGAKWPELAKEALPGLTRVGYLINPTNVASVATMTEARRSAETLRMDFRSYPVERPADLESAFTAMMGDGIGVLLPDAAHPYPTNWPRVAGLALGHKLPAISELREFVFAGGLMSYGGRLFDMTRRLAHYVDRILKGAKAGDIPVEQPAKFELVINLKTAKALGLTIPDKLLTVADEVIE
jgi:putative tryptophan/tyrosine transport system substrate-binding protein